MEKMEPEFISFEILERFLVEILTKAGIPQEDAVIVSDTLMQADKFGFDSHGVNRLKSIYLDRIKDGIINPVTNAEIIKEGPATAVIDGHNGMGQVISHKAMELAIEKAGKFGLGMVVVRNSNHYGFAGYYPLMAVSQDMIGITGTNARPSIAPTFGVENVLGTNPLTFGIPTDEPFPFLLDCATSITQRGKIELYAREGKMLPGGWVIDENGETKTDPVSVLDDLIAGRAALSPLGGVGEDTAGYKGYGYATVVEILSSALQQGAFLKMLLGLKDGRKVPYCLGHFFIAVNISSFTEVSDFKLTTGNILREIRASRKMPGQKRIYTAGEKEYYNCKERTVRGVSFSRDLLNEFSGLCKSYGMENYLAYFNN
ncbi:MAG: Ldh family oxidoreductase [Bacteroidales bacterium]|jgi:LDH2 family malate/lactate/ureidoglycolate dehydrogenase